MAKAKSGLTDKEELFCYEYLVDLNATNAYVRVGYSQNGAAQNACRLITNDKIRARIRELMDERSANILIDAHFVVHGLIDVAQRCRQATPVMTFDPVNKMMVQKKDEDGQGVWEFDSNGANKALELLAKHQGIFEKDNNQKQPIIKNIGFSGTE